MNHEDAQSRIARQAANRKAHPIWRGIFIYAITCNLTILLTPMFTGRDLDSFSHPRLSEFVEWLYFGSEVFLLFISPFFIRRFGVLAKLGLAVAVISLLFGSICGRA